MWGLPCCRAATTSPSADRERLMYCASLSCCPAASDLATRSDPVYVEAAQQSCTANTSNMHASANSCQHR